MKKTTIQRNVDLSSTAVRSLAKAGAPMPKASLAAVAQKHHLAAYIIWYIMNTTDLELVTQALD